MLVRVWSWGQWWDSGCTWEQSLQDLLWIGCGGRDRNCYDSSIGMHGGVLPKGANPEAGEGRAREDQVLFVDVEFAKRVSCQGRM